MYSAFKCKQCGHLVFSIISPLDPCPSCHRRLWQETTVKADPTYHIADGKVHSRVKVQVLGTDGDRLYIEWPNGSRSWEPRTLTY